MGHKLPPEKPEIDPDSYYCTEWGHWYSNDCSENFDFTGRGCLLGSDLLDYFPLVCYKAEEGYSYKITAILGPYATMQECMLHCPGH